MHGWKGGECGCYIRMAFIKIDNNKLPDSMSILQH